MLCSTMRVRIGINAASPPSPIMITAPQIHPTNGVMTYAKIEYLEPAPEPLSFKKKK